MNFEKFLQSVGVVPLFEFKEENMADSKEASSYIKKLQRTNTRFNDFLKKREHIRAFMGNIPVERFVKEALRPQLKEASKSAYTTGLDLLRGKDEVTMMDKATDKILSLIEHTLDKNMGDLHDAGEMARTQIETLFQHITHTINDKILNGKMSMDPITKIIQKPVHLLNRERLEKGPQVEYYDHAIIIIRYMFDEIVDVYNVIFALQTIMGDVVKKIRQNKNIQDSEKKSSMILEKLTRYYQQFLKEEFGTYVGNLTQSLSKDYYRSSQDQKAQEDKLFTEFLYLLAI